MSAIIKPSDTGRKAFIGGDWQREINVRDFIQRNYTPYTGNEAFLSGASIKTKKLWNEISILLNKEVKSDGVLDVDTDIISTITSHQPGYIDRSLEVIVGLQTDEPLKRALMPFGGFRVAKSAVESYDRQLSPKVSEVFQYRKTHNDGVFDVYDEEIRAARRAGIITGLPDAYGRGRIIGDYRRVALYGVDRLIDEKIQDKNALSESIFDEDTIRLREELSEQIRALQELKQMAAGYGFDIGVPAESAHEAIQWTYFGYLAAILFFNGG